MNRIYKESILDSYNINGDSLITEGISISARNPKTSDSNLNKNIDDLWKDVRSIFKLLDKVGERTAKNGEDLRTTKTAIMASTLELRRQIKHNQRDLAQLRKFLEKEVKEVKTKEQEMLREIKKMIDLFINPPAAMGPTSRKTGQPHSLEGIIKSALKDALKDKKES